MRNLGIQAQTTAAHARLPQLVPTYTSPNPSGRDPNLRVVSLRHPRGFPFGSRRLDRWWRLIPSPRSGTELCFVTHQAHPIGAHVEVGIPLRTGVAALRGDVIRVRQSGPHWETTLSLGPESVARASLLARICSLEGRLYVARPLVRLREARRRAEEWQRLLRRLAQVPALYAGLLTSRRPLATAGWSSEPGSAAKAPPRPRAARPQ